MKYEQRYNVDNDTWEKYIPSSPLTVHAVRFGWQNFWKTIPFSPADMARIMKALHERVRLERTSPPSEN